METPLGSGSFRSNTGAKLDIIANWSAKSIGNNQAEVTVTVVLDSYSLHLNAVPGSVNLSLGGQYASLDGPEINYDGSDMLHTTLGSKSFIVDMGSELSLAVEWQFGGTYSGIDLPVVECGGRISL